MVLVPPDLSDPFLVGGLAIDWQLSGSRPQVTGNSESSSSQQCVGDEMDVEALLNARAASLK
jgi:hypothetical protein